LKKEIATLLTAILILVLATMTLGLGILATGCEEEEGNATATASPGEGSPTATGPVAGDIVDAAIEDGRFVDLVAALDAAGLTETLKGEGPFTVFAPTDEAFDKLPEGELEALLEDTPALTRILEYHVVPEELMIEDLAGMDSVTTLLGEDVTITLENGNMTLNDEALVVISDVQTTNGVIHVIDTVLMPPEGAPSPTEGNATPGEGVSAVAEEMPPTPPGASPAEGEDIVVVIVNDGRFATLVAALEEADLAATLKEAGPYTVFAPTDEAFEALPEGTVEGLLQDIPTLTRILGYHVVPGSYAAEDLVSMGTVTTVSGDELTIAQADGNVTVDGAQVVGTMEAPNGVVHVIDAVLEPPAVPASPMAEGNVTPPEGEDIVVVVINDGRFETLVAALEAADLVATLQEAGPYTVFAPTDEAFNALPEGTVEGLLQDIPALTEVLTYHVVPDRYTVQDLIDMGTVTTVSGQDLTVSLTDGNVTVDGAQIIGGMEAGNGVVYYIDAVLTPSEGAPAPGNETPEEGAAPMAEGNATPAEGQDIVSVVVDDGNFETLVAALEAADLVAPLQEPGPYTVFAPSDAAFASVPVEDLLQDIPRLTEILKYHVVEGDYTIEDLATYDTLTTLSGKDLTISRIDSTVSINGAQIVGKLGASNGVVYVVDNVLMPPAAAPAPPAGNVTPPAEGIAPMAEGNVTAPEGENIAVIIIEDGRFQTLVQALEAADLAATLEEAGPFTVFAPTDEAFEALPEGELEALLADEAALSATLLYHVIDDDLTAEDLVTLGTVATLSGEDVTITEQDGYVYVNEAKVVATMEAPNGVIHVIDAVLMPPQ
jgi:transforming growth factor-beta-induced protein